MFVILYVTDNEERIREWLDSFEILTEKDFYPPADDRVVCSGIENNEIGDNFNDYLEDYYVLCKENGIYD